MKKQTWLWSLIMLPAFLIGDATASAFGTYGINSEDFETQKAERLAARMLSITANQNLSRKQLKELSQVTNQLRNLGPQGLNAAVISRQIQAENGTDSRQLELIDQQLDIIAGQKQALACRLYWYKSLDAAKARSNELDRPILSLRMLGNLDEDLSCANSRFFRQVLYTNPEIAKSLRQRFILHWQPVRDVPIATIDFGNGRKLRQPIIGNSVHFVLNKDGRVIDALPGLVTPDAFIRWTKSVLNLHHEVQVLSESERNRKIQLWHRDRAQRRRQQSELTIRDNQMVIDLNPLDPKWKLAAESLKLTSGVLTRSGLDEKSSNASAAMRLAPLKMAAELPVLRMVDALAPRVEQDSFFNLHGLQPKLDDWYTQNLETGDDEFLTHRIYKELFLMPLDDPWLGLSPDDRYIALENRGRHNAETGNISGTEALNTSTN